MEVRKVKCWSRSDISTCNCSEKQYRHVHCPCSDCKGRATDRSTELRHWNQTNVLIHHKRDESQLVPIELQLETDLDDSACQSTDSESEVNFLENNFSDGEEEIETDCSVVSDFEEDLLLQESCEQPVSDEPTVMTNPMRKLVVTAVLNALKIKRDSGVSIGIFEDFLKYAKKLLLSTFDDTTIDRDILTILWPKTWNDVQSLLREEGYEDAKQFYICICRQRKGDDDSGASKYSYSGKYSIMEGKDDLCSHCGKKSYLTYYYLGLNSKIKNWFRNETLCEKMLSHWKERDHWLGKCESWPLKRELWDGQRWVDLQWFWDPDKTWALPSLCPSCGITISADHLGNSSNTPAEEIKMVECPECLEIFHHTMKFANGSPLNLALIGHWDGWQPFGSSLRSCGSVEVSIANMKKEDRNHVDEVYVVGFVPSYVVPNIPEALDPFLHPLMIDLCKGFIDGFEVNYQRDIHIEGYQASHVETVRVL